MARTECCRDQWRHPQSKNVKENLRGAHIKHGQKFGAGNANIVSGVVIGENALVGAGAVVTHQMSRMARWWSEIQRV